MFGHRRRHTCGDRARVHAVDGDIVGLSQLLGPYTGASLVGGFGGCVYSLPGYTETRGSGRDKHDSATSGKMWLSGLCEEDGTLDIGVKMCSEEMLCDLDEVGIYTQCSTACTSRLAGFFLKRLSSMRGNGMQPLICVSVAGDQSGVWQKERTCG
jgi:hypothetical protein